MGRIELFSPAKINLFLAVVGRRGDGFHELVSLAAQLDFGDTVRVEAEPAGARSVTLSCDDPSLPLDAGNIAYRAAERFLERFGLSWSARVALEKRIPHGAGLGGGSGDAATALRGLASLCGVDDPAALRALAAELGSDCPLFLEQAPAIMRGRGERLERLEGRARESLAGRRVLLLKPSFSIGTAWAYRALAARGEGYGNAAWAEARLAAWAAGEIALEDLLFNAFEAVAFAKFPALPEMRDAMGSELGAAFLMSGSGSCCFALLPPSAESQAIPFVEDRWGKHVFAQWGTVLI